MSNKIFSKFLNYHYFSSASFCSHKKLCKTFLRKGIIFFHNINIMFCPHLKSLNNFKNLRRGLVFDIVRAPKHYIVQPKCKKISPPGGAAPYATPPHPPPQQTYLGCHFGGNTHPWSWVKNVGKITI